MKKSSKKPTTKEIVQKIYDIEVGLNQLYKMITNVKVIIDAYVEMNNDSKRFTKYIEKILKEEKDDKARKQPGDIKVVKK
jgi:regulator of replication initiation timing